MVVKRNRTLGSFIVNTKTVSPVARAYGERTDMYIRLPHVFKNESKKIKRREASFVSCPRIEANDTTKNMELRFYVSFSCICAFLYNLFNIIHEKFVLHTIKREKNLRKILQREREFFARAR